MEIGRTYSFEAAHRLPHTPEGHKCRRLHGHSFRVEVQVSGELREPQGWVYDFALIDEAWEKTGATLDHRYLNEIDGLENPTSENLAIWLWGRLEGLLPGLCTVIVSETCNSKCVLKGN
jgi:6-pyruvoyltetrahydropterin/6-carboxytetrahydropterin synthase